MAKAAYQCQVHSDFNRLWDVLLDEIEHPDKYNPGIKGVKIIERFNNGVLRCISVPDAEVRERITFRYEEGEITSTLVGHPQLEGCIRKLVKNTDLGTTLESFIEWQSTDDNVDQMLRRNVENFIMNGLGQVKIVAENITC